MTQGEKTWDKKLYLTDVEAARLLSVSPQTLRNWRSLGEGPPYIKKNRLVRYRFDDLITFMESGRIEPAAHGESKK